MYTDKMKTALFEASFLQEKVDQLVANNQDLVACIILSSVTESRRVIDLVNHELAATRAAPKYECPREVLNLVGNELKRVLGRVDRPIEISTPKAVAWDSPDHINPYGTKGNSANFAFNYKLAQWIPISEISALEFGCAGGACTKTFIEMGCLAVGIEGSDWCKRNNMHEWPNIGQYLFTSDLTVPIELRYTDTGEAAKFSVAHSWEFIEHISPDNIAVVMDNIDRHLKKDGVVIMSISTDSDVVDGVELHLTVQPKDWWITKLESLGWRNHEDAVAYFGNDWVRGPMQYAPGSFHVVLTRGRDQLPFAERLKELRQQNA